MSLPDDMKRDAQQLRQLVADLRRKPISLQDVIPTLNRVADRLDEGAERIITSGA